MEATVWQRRVPLLGAALCALVAACSSDGGHIDSGCYRITWGHVVTNYSNGTFSLTTLCVTRTNPACASIGELEYEGGVDQNGDGALQSSEQDTSGSVGSDGDTACAHNISADFDPDHDRGKKGLFRVRVTDGNGRTIIDRKTSKRI